MAFYANIKYFRRHVLITHFWSELHILFSELHFLRRTAGYEKPKSLSLFFSVFSVLPLPANKRMSARRSLHQSKRLLGHDINHSSNEPTTAE